MARLEFNAGFSNVNGAVGSWKGILSVRAPTNQVVAVKRVKISGHGTSGDAKPIDVRLTRISAGTGTATTITPQKLNNIYTATVQSVAKKDFTVAPTEDGTDPHIYEGNLHPQTGFVDELTFSDLTIKEGTELLLEVKIPSSESQIPFSGHMICEE